MKRPYVLGVLIGGALGAAAAVRVSLHILAADPTGTGPGGPYEGMDPRFPGMLLSHEMRLLPGALAIVMAGALLGMLIDRLVRRRFRVRNRAQR